MIFFLFKDKQPSSKYPKPMPQTWFLFHARNSKAGEEVMPSGDGGFREAELRHSSE